MDMESQIISTGNKGLEDYIAYLEEQLHAKEEEMRKRDKIIERFLPMTGQRGFREMLTTLMNSTNIDAQCNAPDYALAQFVDGVVACLGVLLGQITPQAEEASVGEVERDPQSLLSEYNLIRSPERVEAVAEYLWRKKNPPSSVSFSEVTGQHRQAYMSMARHALEADMLYRLSATMSDETLQAQLKEWSTVPSEDRVAYIADKAVNLNLFAPFLSTKEVLKIVEHLLVSNDRWYISQEAVGARAAHGRGIVEVEEVTASAPEHREVEA